MSRLANEILSHIESSKDPESLKSSIISLVDYHEKIASEKFDIDLQKRCILLARDMYDIKPGFIKRLGFIECFRIWLQFVFHPHKSSAKISALSCIYLPKYLSANKEAYQEEIEDIDASIDNSTS